MRMNHTVAVCFALLSGIAAFGQDPMVRAVTPLTDPNMNVNLPIQRVGPEDLLTIQVYDSPEFTRSVRISADGTIRLPMLKGTIPVQGLFPNEIEVKVAETLVREKLLVEPFVTVNVAEYHSRPISVSGSVRTPTIFQAIGTVTLLDALARAGGPDSATAGPDVVITKANGPDGAQSVQRIPLKQLLLGTDADLNIKLVGGEAVRIPEVGKIIVEGSVARPGTYPVLDPISNNTVTTAIAQAGGLIQYAAHEAYIIRIDDQGLTHRILVPLWDIQDRKKPDVTLLARDILQVPDSPKRRITQTTIQTLSGVGASTTTGLLIYRHP
jgi:polysaccharide export outer membrane protein